MNKIRTILSSLLEDEMVLFLIFKNNRSKQIVVQKDAFDKIGLTKCEITEGGAPTPMNSKEVLLVLTDEWTDWEAAYAVAEVNSATHYSVKTISIAAICGATSSPRCGHYYSK